MRVHCPVLTILRALCTLYNSAHRDSESNVSTQGSVSCKRTDKDIEQGVTSSIQF